ncbi:MAG: TRAP transporter TatT component family protein [Thermodesulfobacteriota bacterium]
MRTRADSLAPRVCRALLLGAAVIFLAALFAGCGSAVTGAALGLSRNIAGAITDSDDPATVREALPAYMVMLSGMVRQSPDDPDLNKAAADLYSAYAGLFTADRARQKTLTETARGYAFTALCAVREEACGLAAMPFADFSAQVKALGEDELPYLYSAGAAWAGWIAARPDDWNAIAELSRVQALMERVAEQDPAYEHGQALVYLGVLACLLPPGAGGKPEAGKAYFEKAVEVSGNENLMAKVWYAKSYARSVGDKELFVSLLTQVAGADPRKPGLTLANTIAQSQARTLLEETEDYFPEP